MPIAAICDANGQATADLKGTRCEIEKTFQSEHEDRLVVDDLLVWDSSCEISRNLPTPK